MITPTEAHDSPLNFNSQILQRLTEIIGTAISPSKLWVIPLDAERRQLPIILPIDGIPTKPSTAMLHNLMVVLRDTLISAGADSVIFVRERTGTARVSAADKAWAEALTRQGKVSGLGVRGIYLCSSSGITAIQKPGLQLATG